MALQPRQCAHRGQVPHFPLYLPRSRSAMRMGDAAQSSLSESLRAFPRESGSLLQGITSPLGRMVRPETPAAHPLIAMFPASPLAGTFMQDATGSPVTMSRSFTSRERSEPYKFLTSSGESI